MGESFSVEAAERKEKRGKGSVAFQGLLTIKAAFHPDADSRGHEQISIGEGQLRHTRGALQEAVQLGQRMLLRTTHASGELLDRVRSSGPSTIPSQTRVTARLWA
jgi:hypothetical protein